MWEAPCRTLSKWGQQFYCCLWKIPRDGATALVTITDSLSASSRDALDLIQGQPASRQSCSVAQLQSIQSTKPWGLELLSLIAKRERFTKRDCQGEDLRRLCLCRRWATAGGDRGQCDQSRMYS